MSGNIVADDLTCEMNHSVKSHKMNNCSRGCLQRKFVEGFTTNLYF